MRVSKNDASGMALRLLRSMVDHGLAKSGDSILVSHGSKANGNANRVGLLSNGTSSETFGTYHFGFTVSDVYDRMHTMAVALETSTYAKRNASEMFVSVGSFTFTDNDMDDILSSVKLAEDSGHGEVYATVRDYVTNHYGVS